MCLESGTAYAENKTKGIKVTDLKEEDLSACCEAPLFWELQDDTDLFSGLPVCEVCGLRQYEDSTISTGAILETHNFTFYAFGNSKSECRQLLEDRWKLHQKQTNASYEFEELADSVFYFGITQGAFRNGELPEGK